MSRFRSPIGPQPSTVYWRRRLAVALGLVVVIFIVVLIIVRPGAGATSGDAAPTKETADAAVEPSEEPVEVGEPGDPCTPQNLKIAAVTDQDLYRAGEAPAISMTLTNVGAVSCMLDVTSTLQVYAITSGAETYWLSSDCQAALEEGAPPVLVLLKPNEPQSTAPLSWDRTRSSPTTCEGDRPAVPGGDATYALQVKLGELESAKKAFRLL